MDGRLFPSARHRVVDGTEKRLTPCDFIRALRVLTRPAAFYCLRKVRKPLDPEYNESMIDGRLTMASNYRRQQECEIWHFCSNCSKWPQDHYVEQDAAQQVVQ